MGTRVWSHDTPSTHTRTLHGGGTVPRPCSTPGLRNFQRQKFGHLMFRAGSIWFTHLPQRRPEKDALNLISPCQAVGLGRQSFSIYSQMTDPQGAGRSPLRSPILSEGWGESGGPGGQWRLWGLHSIHLPRGIRVILLHLFLSLSLSLSLSPFPYSCSVSHSLSNKF